jgi:hypothetical protein
MRLLTVLTLGALLATAAHAKEEIRLDQREAWAGDWGYRPAEGDISAVNPPAFVWRPQRGLVWEVQCARNGSFERPGYRAGGLVLNVHCPPETFEPGTYRWRYRGRDAEGRVTGWSVVRTFVVPPDAVAMPLPARAELLARVPARHPRLLLRPESLPRLRKLAKGRLADRYARLVRECETLLADPPPTEEPPRYPRGMVRRGEAWRKMWWGNRRYTIRALNGAATLAFTRLLDGNDAYGREAKRILLACARWDPRGSTGYRYNDEAGMPYAYFFARTYSYLNDLLSEEERRLCRRVMRVRGRAMYDHLNPRHLWRPYESHSNRAWHFLGEVGIAFLGEIQEAADWVWFAANVFFSVYPAWSDDDGGWHEGSNYWASYQGRFTWWADAMREAMRIDAYRKPYYSRIGDYAMHLMPPGKVGGGFGDLNARKACRHYVPLMTVLAAQARNPYWQWWVERNGGPKPAPGYVGFLRGALPAVPARRPDDRPASKVFRGIGQACLNGGLLDARSSTQVVFKSSPFGTQSHGYEANNSFLLWAYGQRLLVRSGYRDMYGSAHHRDWMWTTRSTNCITFGGLGQLRHTARARGRIVDFVTTPAVDVVVGECGGAYDPDAKVERFTRAVVLVRPDLVIVCDLLAAGRPSTHEYRLHATDRFEVVSPHELRLEVKDVTCDVDFLVPASLTLTQTDQYDPNPRERVELREWHLTASTAEEAARAEFVAVFRVRRGEEAPAYRRTIDSTPEGHRTRIRHGDARIKLVLPRAHRSGEGLTLTLERADEPARTVRVRLD